MQQKQQLQRQLVGQWLLLLLLGCLARWWLQWRPCREKSQRCGSNCDCQLQLWMMRCDEQGTGYLHVCIDAQLRQFRCG
jgi:hypothetical protein